MEKKSQKKDGRYTTLEDRKDMQELDCFISSQLLAGIKEAVTEVRPVNDRVILARLDAKPRPMNIIQVYLPTTAGEEVEVKDVYAKIQREIDEIPKIERLVIMGDFNTKIGSIKDHVACGKFGLTETNERGEMLLDWMENNNLIT
ncbi:craniofacial development protein 2-like [Penaeus monodon]|uniref:craniofacial development protein 2-like n=1 Tax=Penaeus monodon TaxID=6687 RepID=UPI0018A6E3C4|nr:craniofacial development protein 2-like [Penaeus monodon]